MGHDARLDTAALILAEHVTGFLKIPVSTGVSVGTCWTTRPGVTQTSQSVEVSGRYSNHADQEKRIGEVLRFELSRSPKQKTHTRRQIQRRLSADEVEALLGSYERGSPVNVLADEFHIQGSTVLDRLKRSTAHRRYPGLDERGTQLAIQLCESGLSLREVGISPECTCQHRKRDSSLAPLRLAKRTR